MKMVLRNLLLLVFLLIQNELSAQVIVEDPEQQKLPFAIAKEKHLPDEELAAKKEGVYMTGIPNLSSDPLNGFGAGIEGSLFFNGKRKDPLFAYTPYRARLDVDIFATTKLQREIKLSADIPYIFNTKWRLRAEAAYEINPNNLYFGITEQTLEPLSYYPNNDPSKPLETNASYKDYEKNMVGSKAYYNYYTKKEAVLNISMERSFFQGKLRALIGYEVTSVNLTTPLNDSSLLHQDALVNRIVGYGRNLVTLAQVGLIYDTRDLETDPSKGSFAELTNELSLTGLGSQYNFNKTFFHYNLYLPVLPRFFKRMTFAGRMGIGYTQGNSPFYEYQDEWSSEGSIEGLGGGTTLRGYKQSRFLARVMEFSNFELRYRFARCEMLKQYLAFSVVPFFDIGGVWDNLSRINHLENLRYSQGVGLRIAWNINTILRFDYAFSQEDKQFFFSLGHAF